MVAGTERGVGYSNSTTQKFTLLQTKKTIDLEIAHDFFDRTWNDGNASDMHLGSNVIVKNVGDVSLIDVKVYVDIDDDMPAFDALVYATEEHPSGTLGNNQAILHFGNLSPGATSAKRTYWWTVRPRFPGATGSQERTVTFNLYPTFTVDYRQADEIFQSKSKITNS